MTPSISLDGRDYWYERKSYKYHEPKSGQAVITAGDDVIKIEGGLNVKAWRMNIICQSRQGLDGLSGSFIKTHPDSGSSVFNELAFTDNVQIVHTVFFDDIGTVEQLDRAGNFFKAPIRLSETT